MIGYALFAVFLIIPLIIVANDLPYNLLLEGWVAGGILLGMLGLLILLAIKRRMDYRAGDKHLRPDHLYPLWYSVLVCGAYLVAIILLTWEVLPTGEPTAQILLGISFACFGVMVLARFVFVRWLAKSYKVTLQQPQAQPETGEAQKPVDQARMKKLQQLIKVSDRLTVQQLAQILEMKPEEVWKHVPDWAEKYQFRIAEEVLIFNKDTVDAFVANLDEEFSKWGKTGKKA